MSVNQFPAFDSSCRSLLKKHLTKEMFDQLKNKVTANGYSFSQAIRSGVVNQDSSIGVYAGDAESYHLFARLFDPIIEEYHGFKLKDQHDSNLNPDDLQGTNPDPEGRYIVSTRIRVGRNLAGTPLGPAVTKKQRNEIAQQILSALDCLSDDLSGTYYPLQGMREADHQRLIEDHFLFKAGDRFLEAAGLNRDWPEGRGLFHNKEKTFLVWVNEEDQLRIISMQQGGDLSAVFTRLTTAVNAIEQQVPFLFDEHLGYLSSCPTNLGTAMRASVHICLPKIAEDMKTFQQLADQYHLQIRGIHGEHSESQGGVFDISNRRRLGVSEVACVQDLYDGVVALIQAEEKL